MAKNKPLASTQRSNEPAKPPTADPIERLRALERSAHDAVLELTQARPLAVGFMFGSKQGAAPSKK